VGFLIANILTNAIMGIFIFVIIVKNRTNLWEKIIVGNSLPQNSNEKDHSKV